jgi:hypothetical protein
MACKSNVYKQGTATRLSTLISRTGCEAGESESRAWSAEKFHTLVAKQQEQYCVATVIYPGRGKMKVALAHRYRSWMLILFPATLGLGTAALWFHSRNWPLNIDEGGVRFRSHRHVAWNSIRKICVSRSYLDGHVSQMRIHHTGGVSRVPVDGLDDGQRVVKTILSFFAQISGAPGPDEHLPSQPAPSLPDCDRRTVVPRRSRALEVEFSQRNAETRPQRYSARRW